MGNHARRCRGLEITVRAVLTIVVVLGLGSSVRAAEGKWTFRLEPMILTTYGHDQHVLTVHEIDSDSTPSIVNKTAVSLDSGDGSAFHGEFRYARGQWTWGIDLFWFLTTQGGDNLTAVADGPSGTIDQVIFEVADLDFVSTDPGEVLFYDKLEDTDLEVWTVDAYAMRTLSGDSDRGVHFQFGLRVGDFDNDYHTAVGIQDTSGVLLDASSNYGLMVGPIVGLSGNTQIGKSSIEGYIGQSLLIGSVELSRTSREFTGPFGPMPAFFAQESLRTNKDVAIPVTEFRLRWTYRLSRMVALGVGANTSAWWDVSVPPGVIPIQGGDEALHENTIVFFGMTGAVELTF